MKSRMFAIVAIISAFAAGAAEVHKADNTDAMNLASSWVENRVPGAEDTIVMHPFTTTQTFSLGGDMSVLGLILTNNAGLASLNFGTSGESGVMTLGADGMLTRNSGKTVTIYTKLKLAEDQLWKNDAGALQFGSDIDLNGHGLTINGGVELKGSANAHDGTIEMTAGYYKMSSGNYTTDTDFILRRNAGLQFNQAPAPAGMVRARNVTLDGSGHSDGAVVYANGRKENHGNEVISGKLTLTNGLGIVRLNPNAAKHMTMEIGALVQSCDSTLNVRGTNLGLSPAADLAANHSTLKFTTAPTLVGGGGAAGTTSVSILPWTVCSTNDQDYGIGFATYDSTYGVRPLDLKAEYASTIVSGSAGNDNVRLTNGVAHAALTTTLSPGTTEINSLILDTPNNVASNGGVVVTGPSDAVLKVKSGMVYARQMMAAVYAVDALRIEGVTLDLNGNGGQFISRQTKQDNMTSNAPLQLDCVITNDGGKGVTFASVAGRGLIYLTGTSVSTYTGPTRCNSGNLRLCKSKDPTTGQYYPAIPGDLYVYGGAVQNCNRQLNTNANVYVCGGNYLQKAGASNSGSGASQDFHNLYVTAGSASSGTDGTSSGATLMNDAVIAGGTWRVTRGHQLNMQRLTCCGGVTTFCRWNAYNGYRCRPNILNGVVISNVAATVYGTAYEPIIIESGAYDAKNLKSIPGGDLYLSKGLTFVGNGNPNTVSLISQVPPVQEGVGQMEWGKLRLDSVEDFDVGNGAADVDLRITAIVKDDDWDNLPGGICKKGAGTLMLTKGGDYTAGTDVKAGRLIVDGTLAGNVTVAEGAVFRGGDCDETSSLSVGGSVTFAAGAKLEADPGAVMTVAGTLTLADTEVVLKPGTAPTGPVLIARAAAIAGAPTSNLGKYTVKRRNQSTELWLDDLSGLTFFIK